MKKLYIASLVVLVIWIIWPLLHTGYIPTHDGEFSIIRIWQYSKMLKDGNLYPRWAPDLNSGYGVPLFTFYYPLPYFIGSLFHIVGFSLVDSFKLTMACAYISAVVLCFYWLKKIFNIQAATIGSLLFLSVPYWFVNLYVRGSVGEVMAMSSLMLLLVGIEYQKIRLAVFAFAALIISHNISALIFLPLVIGYSYIRRKISFAFILWGLAMSAFFWVPALLEQKFVMGLSNFNYRDHFPQIAQLLIPSWGTGFSGPGWTSNEMPQQIGVAVLLLLFMKPRIWAFAAIIIFLMLEQSVSIWEKIAPLRFIQYPWRFLAIFIPLTGILGASVASKNRFLAIGICAISLLFVFQYSRPVIYPSRSDDYYLSKRIFTDGTTSVGNSFSTRWLPWQSERPKEFFEVNTDNSIIANRSYYPGWSAVVDGKKVEVRENGGRIQFDVPPGVQNYELRFHETTIRLISDGISIVSLFWLLVSTILDHRYAYSNRFVSHTKRS